MEPALAQLCADAEDVVRKGTNIVILTDREVSVDRIAIPALLATAAVHHHLVRAGLRTRSGLVVETGSAREVHHFACLAATAPRRSTPTSPSPPSSTSRTRCRRRSTRRSWSSATSRRSARACSR
jgi:glutamate synthase (NADPH/NADH) large chain